MSEPAPHHARLRLAVRICVERLEEITPPEYHGEIRKAIDGLMYALLMEQLEPS